MILRVGLTLLLIAGLCAAPAAAQSSKAKSANQPPAPQAPQEESLGALARKLRAEKKNSEQKPAKVFTNENIPQASLHDGVQVIGPAPAESTAPATGPGQASASAKPGEGHDEKFYRDALKDLRDRKALHEHELDLLESKLGDNQTQYYPDPNKALKEQYSRSDINKKQDEIEKKKQEIADDEKAIQDLQDKARREGAPASWIQ